MSHPAQVQIRLETAGQMFGVEGRFQNAYESNEGFIATQVFLTTRWLPGKGKCLVEVRFDDNPRNNHETLSITGDWWDEGRTGRREPDACGCVHDIVADFFPELARLIPFHLCSVDGPMHYVANTVYLAGDRDRWGLRQGEQRPFLRGGKPGAFCYEWRTDDGRKPYDLDRSPNADDAPVTFKPCLQMITGEGKARQLDAAREVAIWPDATDEQLSADPDELRAALLARLPALKSDFKSLVLGAGFLWPSRLAQAT